MPILNADQKAAADQVKLRLAVAKSAIGNLIDAVETLRGMAAGAAAGSPPAAIAADDLMILKGEAQKALGGLNAAHGAASKSLIVYDTDYGTGVVAQGGGAR